MSYVLQYKEPRKIYGVIQRLTRQDHTVIMDKFIDLIPQTVNNNTNNNNNNTSTNNNTTSNNNISTDNTNNTTVTRRNLQFNYAVKYTTPTTYVYYTLQKRKKYSEEGKCLFNENTNLINDMPLNFEHLESLADINILTDFNKENTINFGENTKWGCSIKMDLDELKFFCNNQVWKKLAIYNILKNITLVGIFGNADRHYILDWLESDPFNIDDYQSIWDETKNACLIPSIIKLDFVYVNVGLVDSKQSAIVKVVPKIESTFWYNQSDELNDFYENDTENNYNVHIWINFYKIQQQTTWYFAPGPQIVYPKNIMYPFRVGETQYWKRKIPE